VASVGYWVEISRQGTRLGAGFLLNKHHAITASHCLRNIASDDEHLELAFANGDVAQGRVCERSLEADLALIAILEHKGAFTVPKADRASSGDKWSAPYRPSTGDPLLGGDVLSGAMTYQCEAGYEIEALQLGCSQRLGDYSGYSGGPVERHITDAEPRLLGVLLEQYPDRQAAERASDVLFAASMAEALRRFNCLGAGHLMDMLLADGGTPQEHSLATASHRLDAARPTREQQDSHSPRSDSPLEPHIAAANSIRDFLLGCASSGALDPTYVSPLMLRVALRIVESNWIDDK